MRRLNPSKLKVRFLDPCNPTMPERPRKYTLTHSDLSGNLYLTVAAEHDIRQVSGMYTRLMRDEVLGEWKLHEEMRLEIYLHVSGGLVLGSRSLRDRIFRRELPLALEAIRYGDRDFFEARPKFDDAIIEVHFRSTDRRYDCREDWGTPSDYA